MTMPVLASSPGAAPIVPSRSGPSLIPLPQAGTNGPFGSPSGAVAMPVGIGSGPVTIPVPARGGLGEMDGTGDRTQIVEGDENLKTTVGVPPFGQNEQAGPAVPSLDMQENIPTGDFNPTGAPRWKAPNGSSTPGLTTHAVTHERPADLPNSGGNLRPASPSGFHVTVEHEDGHGDTDENQLFGEAIEPPLTAPTPGRSSRSTIGRRRPPDGGGSVARR